MKVFWEMTSMTYFPDKTLLMNDSNQNIICYVCLLNEHQRWYFPYKHPVTSSVFTKS